MLNQNLRQKGLNRDRRILLTIEEYQALDALQIQTMFFAKKEDGKPFQQGQRKAQERLLALHRQGKLNRKKVNDIYAYYLDKQPGMIKHLIDTNWVRLWLKQTLSSWEKLQSWTYENDYKILRCDGFAAIKNNMTGKFRFLFIEMDRGTNDFDKIEKYNKLFESEKLNKAWWFDLTERFPPVQVVTLYPDRKKLIQRKIEAHNSNGLEFRIILLDEVRREVMKCLNFNGPTD
jgi:hypothetical protein